MKFCKYMRHIFTLFQVQDAGNHLQAALDRVTSKDVDYEFGSGEEVLKVSLRFRYQSSYDLWCSCTVTVHRFYAGRNS